MNQDAKEIENDEIDYNDLGDWSLDDLVDEREELILERDAITSQLIAEKKDNVRGSVWYRRACTALSHKKLAIRKVERRIGEISDNPVDVELIKRSYEIKIQALNEEINRLKKESSSNISKRDIKKATAKVHNGAKRTEKSLNAVMNWILENYPERFGEVILLRNETQKRFDEEQSNDLSR